MKQRKVMLSILFGVFCLTLHKTWSDEPLVLTPVPGYSLPSAIKVVEPTEFNPEELPSALDYARTITPETIDTHETVKAPEPQKAAPHLAKARISKGEKRKHVAKFKTAMKKRATAVSMKASSSYNKAARGARKPS